MDRLRPVSVLLCGLCHQALDAKATTHFVPVAFRTTPLFVRCELWCEGCATLANGVQLFRHVLLPKGVG